METQRHFTGQAVIVVDIPRIIFLRNADIGQNGHSCMETAMCKPWTYILKGA